MEAQVQRKCEDGTHPAAHRAAPGQSPPPGHVTSHAPSDNEVTANGCLNSSDTQSNDDGSNKCATTKSELLLSSQRSKQLDHSEDATVDNSNASSHHDEEEDLDDDGSESDDLDASKLDPYSFSDDEDDLALSPALASSKHDAANNKGSSESSRNMNRPDSSNDNFDGDDEGRLVIADDDLGDDYNARRIDPLTLKENVLNLKSDKPRKKHLRFNGMPEEEVAKRLLPDLIKEDLDILIIGINPGMYAAFKGHHYAGPGNHFWKCMFLGGLTPKSMSADDDFKLLDYGIGFTNVVMRATRGSANLTRKEIEEGSTQLIEKLKQFRPKIAVFNGKGIYEVFSGKKEFHFGKQPEKIQDTDTHVWVMPNSSARCAQLPRAVDKVPFYSALKKFRDYLKGEIAELDETEVVFTDIKLKNFNEGSSPKFAKMNSEFKVSDSNSSDAMDMDVRVDPITGKKRRGRPPKPRADGTLPPPKRRIVLDPDGRPMPRGSNPIDPATGKKKRGRPKKADMLAAQAAFDKMTGAEAKREDSSDSFGGVVNSASGGSDDKVEAAAVTPISSHQPVRPLPPFSPNFGRCGAVGAGAGMLDNESNNHEVKPEADVQHEQRVPPSSAASMEDPRARLFSEAAPPDQNQQMLPAYPTFNNGGHNNNFSPNYSNYGSPLHRVPPTGPSPMGRGSASSSDDVTTKSITGLESLVDQIPAIAAENDSGVFSGSGAGSHPNTPRSVGPYSPAAASNFHTSPFHTPGYTTDLNAAAVSVSESSSNSAGFQPTDFSVNSLVHQHQRPSPASVDSAAATVSTFVDSFSVSSLTSSYANDMAAKYAASPYSSGFLGGSAAGSPHGFAPSAAAAAGFFGGHNWPGGQGMPMGMAGMGAMSYYGQYSNTYGAGAAAGAAPAPSLATPSPYTAYMPNPGYPYSHYGQSPYSQSPYF